MVDPYPSEELDDPKEQEPAPRTSAKRTMMTAAQNGPVLPKPSLRELIPVPPEVTLDRMMGLGELVAAIHDDTQAIPAAKRTEIKNARPASFRMRPSAVPA